MRYISMDQAKPGMIVGKSVFNEEGKIRGYTLVMSYQKILTLNPLLVRNWSSVQPRCSTTWILMRHWKWPVILQKS